MSANKTDPVNPGDPQNQYPSTSLNECRFVQDRPLVCGFRFSKNHMTGRSLSDSTIHSVNSCYSKFGMIKFAKNKGLFGDYQIGNVTISRVYYVEGLGHNLFSVGQLCDSNLEVAFR
ncbi:hypothetical protein Tco_0634482 [Tanacetum coccineum]